MTDQQCRHEHFRHVPDRLAECGAQREHRVVVGQQVADQYPGPEAQSTEGQKRSPHPGRKPDDGGDWTGELELVPELGRTEVGACQYEYSDQVSTIETRRRQRELETPEERTRHRLIARNPPLNRRTGARAHYGTDSYDMGGPPWNPTLTALRMKLP